MKRWMDGIDEMGGRQEEMGWMRWDGRGGMETGEYGMEELGWMRYEMGRRQQGCR